MPVQVHTSGEMSNPINIERHVLSRLDGLAAACCAFGTGRPCPALVIELRADAPLPPADGGVESADETVECLNLVQAVRAAVTEANELVPEYSRVPLALVKLEHPAQQVESSPHQAPIPSVTTAASLHHHRQAPLTRTAKGGIVRREVESRYSGWLDERLATLSRDLGGRSLDDGPPTDSMGLAALRGGGHHNKPAAASSAADAILQHVKVALLFAVLIRHLQRFTVRTCHAWDRILPLSAPTCVANNLLQTGAAEGLAFLTGAAIGHQRLARNQVLAPFLLMVAFRHVLHPALEFVLLYKVDIGTAHLWFVLMIGVGRLICWPLGLLARQSPRAPLVAAAVLVSWRLLAAPAHIGLHRLPLLRNVAFYFFYGDRNFHQV